MEEASSSTQMFTPQVADENKLKVAQQFQSIEDTSLLTMQQGDADLVKDEQ